MNTPLHMNLILPNGFDFKDEGHILEPGTTRLKHKKLPIVILWNSPYGAEVSTGVTDLNISSMEDLKEFCERHWGLKIKWDTER